jgi:hypothetical protein
MAGLDLLGLTRKKLDDERGVGVVAGDSNRVAPVVDGPAPVDPSDGGASGRSSPAAPSARRKAAANNHSNNSSTAPAPCQRDQTWQPDFARAGPRLPRSSRNSENAAAEHRMMVIEVGRYSGRRPQPRRDRPLGHYSQVLAWPPRPGVAEEVSGVHHHPVIRQWATGRSPSWRRTAKSWRRTAN